MAEDIIQIQDQYYIRASASFAETRSHVLKHDNCFAVFDLLGNMRPLGIRDHGLFRDDTRFLSRLVLDLQGKQFLLLSSEVREDKDILAVDLTNPEFTTSEGQFIGQDTLHVLRTTFLWNNVAYERIRIHNYGSVPFRVPITLRFEADFADIFEVRGIKRPQRGEFLPAQVLPEAVILRYCGLDGVERQTHLRFSPAPDVVSEKLVQWWVPLAPQEERDLSLTVVCSYKGEAIHPLTYGEALQAEREQRAWLRAQAHQIDTGNVQFNDWLNASRDDLLMMLTRTPYGLYPYAGVPWFTAVFGRDALITALATLWWFPELARGVLLYLAAHQAQELDPSRDAEPGKILHEQRRSEMAQTREIPFGNYFGSIDATPLFVVLAGRYVRRSGDLAFLEQLWPHIEAALHWMDTYGDADGDGFLEYAGKAHRGLRNQGWKDSEDSVFYPDGSLRCKAMPTKPKSWQPRWQSCSGDQRRRLPCANRPNDCSSNFWISSGVRNSMAMPWRWMVTRNPVGCAVPTWGTVCFRGLPIPNTLLALPDNSWIRPFSVVGAFARCRKGKGATIPCPTTTVPFGPTTTP